MTHAILLGSDHAGFPLKEELKRHLEQKGVPVEDLGTHGEVSVDYPAVAHAIARAVACGAGRRGVIVCGTGIGVSIAANRHAGVRAAVAFDETTARLSREHNDANVLALGSRTLDHGVARRILDVWLETPFAGGRHARRVAMIEPVNDGTEVN